MTELNMFRFYHIASAEINKTCFSTIVITDRNLPSKFANFPTEFANLPTEFDDKQHKILRIYHIAFADGNSPMEN